MLNYLKRFISKLKRKVSDCCDEIHSNGFINTFKKISLQKQLTLIIAFMIVIAALTYVIIPRGKNNTGIIKTDHYKIQVNKKWGFVDSKGKIVVEPIYDSVYDMHEGLAPVSVKGKWGFVNSSGQLVIDTKYEKASFFNEDLAAVQIDGKWGYIDTKGNIKISPQFENSSYFSEGLAVITKGGKLGFIDTKGRIAIDIKYDSMPTHFQNGYAVVSEGGKKYYINEKGEKITDKSFVTASSFSCGLAYVNDGTSQGYMDTSGNIAIKDIQGGLFAEDLAPVIKNGKWGYINTKGTFVIEPKFSYAGSFSEGLAAVSENGQNEYIDKSGKVVIRMGPTSCFPFTNGVAYVISGQNDWGYINKKGTYIWRFKK